MPLNSFDKVKSYDVIIVGTGLSGLYTALSISDNKQIALITKDRIEENNSNLAQGGISVTFDPNQYQSHIDDTLSAGSNYNKLSAVELLVKEGAQHIDQLVSMGIGFDRDDNGDLLTTKEGGHRLKRIVHAKDETGKAVISVLIDAIKSKANVTIFTHTFMVDVLTNQAQTYGISAIQANQRILLQAPIVVMATGGIGHIYAHTTNAITSTGDGIAAAIRANAAVKGMEFVQFHPTAYYSTSGDQRFLISEAVRGEGGILRNEKGQAFMADKHPLKDLAPRDIVSQAILNEIKNATLPHVFLDVTHLDSDYFKRRFPMIYHTCLKSGINIAKQYIPVRPVEHYVMGGIATSLNCETTINGLYAVGETTWTGLHGANRLASNSLLECLVFGYRAAQAINTAKPVSTMPDIVAAPAKTIAMSAEVLLKNVQAILTEHAYVFRTEQGLQQAQQTIDTLYQQVAHQYCQTVKDVIAVNALYCAKAIVYSAIKRKKSLGAHQIIEEENDD